MDYAAQFVNRIEFQRSKGQGVSQHTFAEVVLLDKSYIGSQPSLYLLKDQALKDASDASFWNNKDLFSHAGYVESIDKKHKIIFLTNQNAITYEHLIVAAGSGSVFGPPLDEAFASGLQRLVDALKIQGKISDAVIKPGDARKFTADLKKDHVFLFCKEDVQQIANQCFNIFHPHLFHVNLAAVHKWLFEVYI
jgi:NADH dehydrogenase FAD-containing subunit